MATQKPQDETPAPRTIATWKPGLGNTALRREITKKQASTHLLAEIEHDLFWGPDTAYRVDVTGLPDVVIDTLKAETDAEGRKTFSFTEE